MTQTSPQHTRRGIVATTSAIFLGWTLILLGIVAVFIDGVATVSLLIGGAVLVSGAMISEAIHDR